MEEAKPGLRSLEAVEVEGVQDLFQEAANALLDNGYPEQVGLPNCHVSWFFLAGVSAQ